MVKIQEENKRRKWGKIKFSNVNICRNYKLNLSDWKHHRNLFEAVHIYISWDFLSLLSPSISVSFSPTYPKVSLMMLVVPYCSLYRAQNDKGGGPHKLVRVLDLELSHCLIPDFFLSRLNSHIIDVTIFFFFFLLTLQTTASLPIIWTGLKFNSPKQILKWNFLCILFADSE